MRTGNGSPEKLLGQFIAYLENQGAATVTTEHALAWAILPGGDANWHAHRLSAVRGFALYLRTIDPSAQVPPAGLIPARPSRATPYPYSGTDITALITAASSLRSRLRVATYQTLVGLLAVTRPAVGRGRRAGARRPQSCRWRGDGAPGQVRQLCRGRCYADSCHGARGRRQLCSGLIGITASQGLRNAMRRSEGW
jgi:hypothetical protein